MNVGINGVSRRGGRWMFSQRGRSERSTFSAGHGPGLLCLSTHHPGVQTLKHASLTDPPLTSFPCQQVMSQTQLSNTLWSKASSLSSPHVSQNWKVLPGSRLCPAVGPWSVGTWWMFRLVLVCTGCRHCDSQAETQNISREQINESSAQWCSWVCYSVFWATGPLMCKADGTARRVAKFTLN